MKSFGVQKARLAITLEPEVLQEAKLRVDNLSQLINDLLKTWLQLEKKEDSRTEKELDQAITQLSTQLNEAKKKKTIIGDEKRKAVEAFNKKVKTREIVIDE